MRVARYTRALQIIACWFRLHTRAIHARKEKKVVENNSHSKPQASVLYSSCCICTSWYFPVLFIGRQHLTWSFPEWFSATTRIIAPSTKQSARKCSTYSCHNKHPTDGGRHACAHFMCFYRFTPHTVHAFVGLIPCSLRTWEKRCHPMGKEKLKP